MNPGLLCSSTKMSNNPKRPRVSFQGWWGGKASQKLKSKKKKKQNNGCKACMDMIMDAAKLKVKSAKKLNEKRKSPRVAKEQEQQKVRILKKQNNNKGEQLPRMSRRLLCVSSPLIK